MQHCHFCLFAALKLCNGLDLLLGSSAQAPHHLCQAAAALPPVATDAPPGDSGPTPAPSAAPRVPVPRHPVQLLQQCLRREHKLQKKLAAANEAVQAASDRLAAAQDRLDREHERQRRLTQALQTVAAEKVRLATATVVAGPLPVEPTGAGLAMDLGRLVRVAESLRRDPDERAFDDPYRFDIERSPNDHVAFGGGGPHYCLGANLARRELRAIFTQLLRNLPGLEVTDEPDYLDSAFINGILDAVRRTLQRV